MTSLFKRSLYNVCFHLGLFHLAKYLLRDKLLILCYHGFAIDDEALFRPKLFMDKDIFNKRLSILKNAGFSVLELGNALDLLQQDKLPNNTACITIDDGFYSVKKIATDSLRAFQFPATIS